MSDSSAPGSAPAGTAPAATAAAPDSPLRFVEDFADPALARRVLDRIAAVVTRPWSIMEVCGGQTHAILRHALDQVLPAEIRLVHGPGCPVCVTPVEIIDQALALAGRDEVTLCTYGDMVRVPGSGTDLARVRAGGGDVRIVLSPLDALAVAVAEPDRQVVFLAVGFETTAPMTAQAAIDAHRRGIENFSLLVSHVLVPPAIAAIAGAEATRVDAFLAAGHVCTVMGWRSYQALAAHHRVPIVVTGFEPLDVLDGVRRAVEQLEAGRAEAENAYPRAVRLDGNPAARDAIEQVFAVCDRTWRGIGTIAASGWRLRAPYDRFDAALRFDVADSPVEPAGALGDATASELHRVAADHTGDAGAGQATQRPEASTCRAGEVLCGLIEPPECAAFGTACTPQRPLGAPMVSDEGACAAYHRYRRLDPSPAGAR